MLPLLKSHKSIPVDHGGDSQKDCTILSRQSSCKLCPEGYFCDGTLQDDDQCSHGVQNPQPCPAGHYCPNGTKYDTEHPCPSGTYNNGTKLKSADECTPCPGGEYCETEGREAPTGPCQAG